MKGAYWVLAFIILFLLGAWALIYGNEGADEFQITGPVTIDDCDASDLYDACYENCLNGSEIPAVQMRCSTMCLEIKQEAGNEGLRKYVSEIFSKSSEISVDRYCGIMP